MTEPKESTNLNSINNPEEQNNKSEPIQCYYCHLFQKDLDIFSCEHKICSICLFRRIFLNNIKDLKNEKDEIEIKCKCNKGNLIKSIEEIFEINNKKNIIYAEKYKNANNTSTQENSCKIHGNKNFIKYCIDCSEELCSDCLTNNTEKHLNHIICPREEIINRLSKDLMETKLKLETKDDFENKWNEICNKIKEESQNNFEEAMLKIEEVAKAIIDFRKDYEEKYQKELTKVVKILKLYKLFYLDYYLQKREAEDSLNINLLRYSKSINYELSNIEITKDTDFYNKLDEIKKSLDSFKDAKSNFSAKFNFSEISHNYKIQQKIEKSHEKLINGIFEIENNKILTGALDFTMKIFQEKNNKFENIKVIKGLCGAICCMAQLNDGSIVTSAANNNDMKIWTKQGDDNYVIKQSFSAHSKPVLSFSQLENGKIISGGWDNLIIIWDKDKSGCYIEKQRIKDKKPITKIISLTNNRFAFTSDNRIRIMIQKNLKENIPQKNEDQNNENKNGMLDDVFDDLDFNQDVEYDKDEENEFIICFQLTKHIGRVRAMIQLKCGYLLSGSGEMGKKKESIIIVWRPNDLDGFYYVQSLHGHKSDINGLIELKDGRIASSSKDRTIRIWKSFNTVDKNNHNVINFEVNEILSEYPHGIYGLIQLDDGRIVSSTNEFSLIVWKDNKFLSYC